jgi:hypothetical protein
MGKEIFQPVSLKPPRDKTLARLFLFHMVSIYACPKRLALTLCLSELTAHPPTGKAENPALPLTRGHRYNRQRSFACPACPVE